MTEDNALRVLQLSDCCTAQDIRQAYRHLVKVWHPDRFGTDQSLQRKAERQLQEVNQAYAVLRSRPQRYRAKPQAAQHPPAQSPPAGRPRTPRPTHALIPLIGGGVALGLVSVVLVVLAGWAVSRWTPSDAPVAKAAKGEDKELPSAPTTRRKLARQHMRPETGVDLIAPNMSGAGSIVLRNSGSRDAVVVLAEGFQQRRATYIRTGQQAQLVDVAPGLYRVSITTGQNWDGSRFTEDAAYEVLTNPVRFAESEQTGTTEHTRLTITVSSMVQNMVGVRPTAPFYVEHR
jgi:hypothetical protein